MSGLDHGSVSPVTVLQALTALRRSLALYPAGHTIIQTSLKELVRIIDRTSESEGRLRVEILDSTAYLEGYPFRIDSRANPKPLEELEELGVACLEIDRDVTPEELVETANLLNELTERRHDGGSLRALLASRGVERVSLTKLVPVKMHMSGYEWPDAPETVESQAYARALDLSRDAVGSVFEGSAPESGSISELVEHLSDRVLGDDSALGQILSIKRYENHTFAHSVNVTALALLLGERLGLDEATTEALGEAALLHDIGKRNVPREILQKPGALNKREWRVMRRHPVYGANILARARGLAATTPTVALEHHRHVSGRGYPDLGDQLPHRLSQILSVVDTYEALTGARPYREPLVPEEACLVVARMAKDQLDPALVKAFISLVTFFPAGSVVRTSRGEIGIVVETSEHDPLHPVIELQQSGSPVPGTRIDTSERDPSGGYIRHIVETVPYSAVDFSREGLAATA